MNLAIERCTYGDLPLYGLFYGEWGIIFLRLQAEAESARDMLRGINCSPKLSKVGCSFYTSIVLRQKERV